MSRIAELPARVPTRSRAAVQLGWDAASWVVCLPIALLLRYDAALPDGVLWLGFVAGLVLGLLQVVVSLLASRLRGQLIIGSLDEVSTLAVAVAAVSILGTGVIALFPISGLPRSVPLIAAPLALTFMLAGRFIVRDARRRQVLNSAGARAVVYGAGEAGDQILRQMMSDPMAGYRPVALLDDDPRKRHARIHGVRVHGDITHLESIAASQGCDVFVVAIASIDAARLRALDQQCTALGIQMRVVPTTSQVLGGAVRLGDLSDITEEDLLGRRPVTADEEAIGSLIENRRILITGAGGSIGSELARQVSRYRPAFLGILDRDESALQALQLALDGRGLLTGENVILADIRDPEHLNEVFLEAKPHVVFHAAALKHLTLLERFPIEGHKTNVMGTRNVLAAAAASGVEVFVNVSTDKAADPSSVLGRTKRETERIISTQAPSADGRARRFISVRFGNVLGSRGSVIPTFRHQIAQGGPVTITDPHATRYFMTIPEAVHLMLAAVALGEHADVLVLDMGKPVRILDVAQELINRSGRTIEIEYTGLRPGEKLDEVLIGEGEVSEPTAHPLVTRIRPKDSDS